MTQTIAATEEKSIDDYILNSVVPNQSRLDEINGEVASLKLELGRHKYGSEGFLKKPIEDRVEQLEMERRHLSSPFVTYPEIDPSITGNFRVIESEGVRFRIPRFAVFPAMGNLFSFAIYSDGFRKCVTEFSFDSLVGYDKSRHPGPELPRIRRSPLLLNLTNSTGFEDSHPTNQFEVFDLSNGTFGRYHDTSFLEGLRTRGKKFGFVACYNKQVPEKIKQKLKSLREERRRQLKDLQDGVDFYGFYCVSEIKPENLIIQNFSSEKESGYSFLRDNFFGEGGIPQTIRPDYSFHYGGNERFRIELPRNPTKGEVLVVGAHVPEYYIKLKRGEIPFNDKRLQRPEERMGQTRYFLIDRF